MDKSKALQEISQHRWSSLRSELLWIYSGAERTCGKSTSSNHQQGYWLWLLRSGSVTVTSGNKTLTARKGQWILSPSATITQQFSKNAQILSIHFRSQWPTGENLFLADEGLVWDATRTPRLERGVISILKLARRHFPHTGIDFFLKSSSYPVFMRFQNRFTLFLADFSEAMLSMGQRYCFPGPCDERLMQAIYSLHEHPLHLPFPWDALMRESRLSRRHIDRLLSTEFGMTAQSYWARLKEEAAIRLLETTSLSIKEVGFQLGFKQASHFTKWFALRLGWNPKKHRQLGASSKAEGRVTEHQARFGPAAQIL